MLGADHGYRLLWKRVRAEKTERDLALAAERKAKARAAELRAQARQIIQDRKVPRSGESEYREVGSEPSPTSSEDDAYYAQFKVPDDLVW